MTPPTTSLALVIATATFLAVPAPAAVIFVSPENDTMSIQEAIESAQDGDVIELAAGTYVESINLLGKAITLTGANRDETIIVGNGLEPAITFNSDETVDTVVDALTINAASGGGGMLIHDSSPTVHNCKFDQNYGIGGSWGGVGVFAIAPAKSEPRFISCHFINNVSQGFGGSMYLDNADATLDGCFFEDNLAVRGAGVYALNSRLQMTGCDLSNNSAQAGAGTPQFGAALFASACDVDLDNCSFTNNTAGTEGGAACLFASTCVMNDCASLDNSAGVAPNGFGGGLAAHESSLEITNTHFSNNVAGFEGGGMATATSTVSIHKSEFRENQALFNGGGLNAANSGNVQITSTTFRGNQSINGGGAKITGQAVVSDCVFWNNIGTMSGGGLWFRSTGAGADSCVVNCTASGNHATDGASIYWAAPAATAVIHNCVLWNNSGGDAIAALNPDTLVVSHSDVQAGGGSAAWNASMGHDGGGNIDVDPNFMDVIKGDLRLAGGPCIDTGDNASVIFEAPDRIRDGDNDGFAIVDMGAHEFAGACAADANDDGIVNIDDIVRVILAWGTTDADADVDSSGFVDVDDLILVLLSWGAC